MSIEIGIITILAQANINKVVSLYWGIMLGFISAISFKTWNVRVNNISVIVISATADIERNFLRKLSLIKNIGNKILATIAYIQPDTNIAFQLFTNGIIFEVVLNLRT